MSSIKSRAPMGNKVVIPVNDAAVDDSAQIIQAIRAGRVDAFVIEEREGHAVYTLANADLPYSTLVHSMQQGAAMVNCTGHVIYCNPSLAELLGTTGEAMVGRRFDEVITSEDRPAFQTLLDELQNGPCEGEFRLCRFGDSSIPARLSLTTLHRDKSVMGVLVSDL